MFVTPRSVPVVGVAYNEKSGAFENTGFSKYTLKYLQLLLLPHRYIVQKFVSG